MKKLIVILLVLLMPGISSAQNIETSSGTFTLLKKNSPAPFEGLLIDPLGIATILSKDELKQKEFDLLLGYRLDKQKTELTLETKLLDLQLKTQEKVYSGIIQTKNEEIAQITKIAEEKGDYTFIYLIGGVIGGILLSLGAVYVVNKIE